MGNKKIPTASEVREYFYEGRKMEYDKTKTGEAIQCSKKQLHLQWQR